MRLYRIIYSLPKREMINHKRGCCTRSGWKCVFQIWRIDSHTGVVLFAIGFTLMMALDVALG